MGSHPKLTLLSHPYTGKTIELSKNRYSLGRKKGNDIVISHASISGFHCELVRNDDGSYSLVDDGNSTNGTRIGGMLITRHHLKDGDVIQFGGIECMYDTSAMDPSTISSINTRIRVATDPIIPNQDLDISPSWLRNSNQQFTTMFKAVVAVLSFFILLLSMIVTLRLIG